MITSQILTFGLAGGFVVLACLLIYFSLNFRLFWRKQARALVMNAKANAPSRFAPLVARFSELALPSDSDPVDLNSTAPDSDPVSAPSPKSKWIWLGVLLAVFFVMLGVELGLIFILRSDGNADIAFQMGLIVAAGLIFAFVCHKILGRSSFIPFKAILPLRSAPPVALWLTNFCLSAILVSTVPVDLPIEMHYLVLGLWIFTILLFCWNVAQLDGVSLPSRESLKTWWMSHRVDILLVAVIGLAALLIRVVGLETYPYAFINDEGEVGWEGLNLLSGATSDFFSTGWAGQPILAFLPVALSIKVLGISAFSVRILGALQGTLAVVALYLLAREAFGRPVAFFSAFLLAALPWHVHFSRLGVMNVGDSFYSVTALWLTYRALRRGRYIDYLPAGLITGLSLYTYVGSRLVVAMAIGVLTYAIIRQRDYLRTHFRHLTVFIFAFLVVASPIMYSFSLSPNEFMGRANTEGLLAENRLQQMADQNGITTSAFMMQQIQNSVTIFFATEGPGQFFDTPRPYLEWWMAVFLFLGMLYVFWNFTQVRYMLLIGWFWAPILLGSALTMGSPSHQRMLSAAPALALILALGLWKFAQSMQKITLAPKRIVLTLCILLVGLTALQDAHFYFVGEFRTGHHFEIEGNEFSYEVGLRAAELGPSYRLLLIGDPFVYAAFADFHYLTNTAMVIEDFNEVTPESIAALPRDKGIFFAAIPMRLEELKLIQKQLPGGKWFEVARHTQEGVLYYGYILDPIKP